MTSLGLLSSPSSLNPTQLLHPPRSSSLSLKPLCTTEPIHVNLGRKVYLSFKWDPIRPNQTGRIKTGRILFWLLNKSHPPMLLFKALRKTRNNDRVLVLNFLKGQHKKCVSLLIFLYNFSNTAVLLKIVKKA